MKSRILVVPVELCLLQGALLFHVFVQDQLAMSEIVEDWGEVGRVPVDQVGPVSVPV